MRRCISSALRRNGTREGEAPPEPSLKKKITKAREDESTKKSQVQPIGRAFSFSSSFFFVFSYSRAFVIQFAIVRDALRVFASEAENRSLTGRGSYRKR